MAVDEHEEEEALPGYTQEESEEEGGWTRLDEFLEAFGGGSHTPIVVDAKDGLPRPADGIVARAPSFSLESFVCAEDESSYCEVFGDEVTPEDYRRLPFAYRNRYDLEGRPVERRTWSKENITIEDRFGFSVIRQGDRFVHVRPVRPRCEFLVQQLDQDDSIDAGGRFPIVHSPYCKRMLSNSGAMLSLRDQNVLACSERSPRDIVSLDRIKRFNERQLAASKAREEVPMLEPAPSKDVLEGTEFYDTSEGIEIDCDPKIAPGKKSKVVVMCPTALMDLIRSGGNPKEVLVVGADWFPEASELGAYHAMGYHNLRLYRTDYAPEGVSAEHLEAFCTSWPTHARFEYVAANLRATPLHLAKRLVAGDDVIVTGIDEEMARFGEALVLRAIGGKSSDYTFRRPEHVSYLRRMV